MPTYIVTYGGQRRIDADSANDAYLKFWMWVAEQVQQSNLGLIAGTEITCLDESPVTAIDLGTGGIVVCDACNRSYSDSDEIGGVMDGGTAYGPCCAPYVWRSCGMVECPKGMSFRAWMLSLRNEP